MRILELSDLYPPFIGGLERYVQMLSNALAAEGHQVAVATASTQATGLGRTREGDVEVYRLGGWAAKILTPFYATDDRPFHPTVRDPGLVSALRDLVTTIRPDVVHAHSWNVFSILPLVDELDLPVLVTAHDYGLACPKKTLVRADGSSCAGPALRDCLPCASDHYGPVKGIPLTLGLRATAPKLGKISRITAVSDYVADRLTAALAPGVGPVTVLNSSVPDGLRGEGLAAPRPDFLPAGDFILYVGALSRHKGLQVLLNAHVALTHRTPLVLLGTPAADTPDPATLPSDVTLVTNVPHAQVIAAMVRATVAVAPSLWPDPLPMTVSEAQLCGTPVVGSATGGITEQINPGVTGLLVPPGNTAALTDALDSLLADPARRDGMASAGPAWAHRYTMSAGVPQVLTELTAAIASRTAMSRARNTKTAPR